MVKLDLEFNCVFITNKLREYCLLHLPHTPKYMFSQSIKLLRKQNSGKLVFSSGVTSVTHNLELITYTTLKNHYITNNYPGNINQISQFCSNMDSSPCCYITVTCLYCTKTND